MADAVKPELWYRLAEPFHPADVGYKPITSGRTPKGAYAVLAAYVSARAVMDRLDSVLTPAGWEDRYKVLSPECVACSLSITVGGRTYTKEGCGDVAVGFSYKSGYSGALKRAAVQFGIGRYLYYLDAPFLDVSEGYPPRDNPRAIKVFAKGQRGQPDVKGWVETSPLPRWALPGGSGRPDRVSVHHEADDRRDLREPPEVELAPEPAAPPAEAVEAVDPYAAKTADPETGTLAAMSNAAFFAAVRALVARHCAYKFDARHLLDWWTAPEGFQAALAIERPVPHPKHAEKAALQWLLKALGHGNDPTAECTPALRAYIATMETP